MSTSNNTDSANINRASWQEHVHELQKYPFVKPTCMNDGNITYWECKKCANRYLDEQATQLISDRDDVIIKSCHTVSYNEEIKATCTTDGRIAHWHCSVCGLSFEDFKCYDFVREQDLVIPKTGHKLVYHGAKTSDCVNVGNDEYWQCEYCGKYYLDENAQQEVEWQQLVRPLIPHRIEEVPYVAPTCNTQGNVQHWTCNRCEKLYSDKNAVTEVEMSDVVLPKLSHTSGTYKYYDSKNHAEVCSRCGELVDVTAHTFSNGQCTVCGYDQTAQNLYQYTPDILTDTLILSGTTDQQPNIIIPSVYQGDIVGVIGTSAFEGKSSLQTVKFGSGVVYIDGKAFKDCDKLTEVQLPFTLKMIGEQAFCNCKALSSLFVPKGVFHIESDAFRGCSGITKITVEQGNNVYESNGSCIVDKDYKCLIFGTSTATIPDDGSVLSIGEYAFCDNDKLTKLVLPNSVVKLMSYAFFNCQTLEIVSFGNSIKTVGKSCFENCISLTQLSLGENVTEIEAGAFSNCASLKSVIVKKSLLNVGEKAFYGCDSLDKIYYEGSFAQWNSIDMGYNAIPRQTKVHFYSQSSPQLKGNYWHYVDGVPKVWEE